MVLFRVPLLYSTYVHVSMKTFLCIKHCLIPAVASSFPHAVLYMKEHSSGVAKKCLRHSGDYGILNIKKDICANRCPTGATDRRLARLFSHKIAVTFGRVGGYFCVLLLSLLPMAYPRPKQVRHKPFFPCQSPIFSFPLKILTTRNVCGNFYL